MSIWHRPSAEAELAALEAACLGGLGQRLLQRIQREIDWRDAKLEKLTFEVAQLKPLTFGKKSEQLGTEQRALFDESVDADIAALEAELEDMLAASQKPRTPSERPKLIWLALRNITPDWGRAAKDWKEAMNQFAILYDDRFTRAAA